MKRSRRRIISFAAAGALAVGAAAVSIMAALPASAATICEQFGSVVAGNYIIMNNRWGSSAPQCINTTSNGFTIIQQDGVGNTSGAPVSYPAIYLGCHYSNCSPNSPLPRQISQIGSANSSISVSYPSSGTWNAAYDIWINADTNVSGVQDTEIMIWLNRQGSIQPIGSPVGTVNLAGRSWQVWTGSNGQNNVVSYLFQGSPLTSFNFNVMEFINDTLSRGSQYGNSSWYLTSVQAGFEPWIGGVGLTVNSFSQSIGGGQQTNPPGTPGTPTASNVTSSSVTLNWSPSSGTVSNYEVDRCQGSNCTNFTQIATPSGTSYTDSGLSANTTYRYRVRATNSAGDSGNSGILTVTTTGGGSGGGCSATFRNVNQWSGGFQGEVTVTNTGSSNISGWTVTMTFANGQSLYQIWGGLTNLGSNPYTVRNESWNGNLGPNGSTNFGFLATWQGTNNPPTLTCTRTP